MSVKDVVLRMVWLGVNIILYVVIWMLFWTITLGVLVGLKIYSPTNFVSSLPGIVGIVGFFVSYRILRFINKNRRFKSLFKQ
jgi:hypothetical protein